MNVPIANKGGSEDGAGRDGGGRRRRGMNRRGGGVERGKIAIINPNLSVFLPINIIYSMQVSERFYCR